MTGFLKRERVLVKRLDPEAKLPVRSTCGAAGFDLCSTVGHHSIMPGATVVVPTGLAFEIPWGWCGLIRPRSSWSSFLVTVSPPIDADYRGQVHVILRNVHQTQSVAFDAGTRVAQIIFVPVLLDMVEVSELSDTDRGAGGFGSTGDLPLRER